MGNLCAIKQRSGWLSKTCFGHFGFSIGVWFAGKIERYKSHPVTTNLLQKSRFFFSELSQKCPRMSSLYSCNWDFSARLLISHRFLKYYLRLSLLLVTSPTVSRSNPSLLNISVTFSTVGLDVKADEEFNLLLHLTCSVKPWNGWIH
jgi:hypothetical protein